MPSDFALKALNRVQRFVMKVSGGRLGWVGRGMPIVELTTVGRKSGEPRTVLLTSPRQEGDTIVLVASRWGGESHPAWFLNLRDNPDVEVVTKGRPKRPMRARVATADERSRLWPLITADQPNYADYQTKTDREIPVVLLDPIS